MPKLAAPAQHFNLTLQIPEEHLYTNKSVLTAYFICTHFYELILLEETLIIMFCINYQAIP